MAEPAKLEFKPDGLYYRMVTSYMAAICGLLIFRKEFQFDRSVKVGLASREYPALEIVPQEVKNMFDAGGFRLGDVTDSLAYMLVNAAYETTVAQYGDSAWLKLREKHLELEFFRHLRNAASHSGVWNLRGNEPTRPAEWRGRDITKALDGKQLFDADLKPGDLLVFLSDVEKLLP